MSTFRDAAVWITGGGSGIGLALAQEFAKRGARVAVSGRRQERLEEAVRAIEAAGGCGLAVPCDVTDDGAVHDAVAAVVAEWGRLDVAVANAGFGCVGRFEDLSDADWKRQMDVNVLGAVSTARWALPELRKTGGRVALISSVMALMAAPRSSAYCASKFALRGIGLCLSQELAGSGVSCTTIHPGFVESEISQVDNSNQHRADWKDKRPAAVMWPADKAARVMVRAIERRKVEYVFTGHGKLGAFLGQHFPGLVHVAMTRFPSNTDTFDKTST
ncbi:MAG: SDR family NAD(P)-dependent oxidoreductase [Myxococcota bacterium]